MSLCLQARLGSSLDSLGEAVDFTQALCLADLLALWLSWGHRSRPSSFATCLARFFTHPRLQSLPLGPCYAPHFSQSSLGSSVFRTLRHGSRLAHLEQCLSITPSLNHTLSKNKCCVWWCVYDCVWKMIDGVWKRFGSMWGFILCVREYDNVW